MSARSFSSGMMPASDSLLALTIIMNRMVTLLMSWIPLLPVGCALPRRSLPHRPDLDGPHPGQGPAGGEGDGLVQVRDVDEHVAAQVLARLGEGPVRQHPLAFPDPDTGRGRGRVERVACQILPLRRELVGQLLLAPVGLLPFLQAQLLPRFAQINQQ